MTKRFEFECNGCKTVKPAAIDVEIYVAPIGWLEVRAMNVVGHLCGVCWTNIVTGRPKMSVGYDVKGPEHFDCKPNFRVFDPVFKDAEKLANAPKCKCGHSKASHGMGFGDEGCSMNTCECLAYRKVRRPVRR